MQALEISAARCYGFLRPASRRQTTAYMYIRIICFIEVIISLRNKGSHSLLPDYRAIYSCYDRVQAEAGEKAALRKVARDNRILQPSESR